MRRGTAVGLGLLAIFWLAAPARAAWTSSAAGSASARATTILPTGTLTATCGVVSASVKLDWAATSSPWADGYEVAWGTSPGGSYPTTATTPSLTYTTPALGIGTYYFVVRAYKGSWRSANSNEVSKSVISVLGIGTCS